MYRKSTRGIEVTVEPEFSPERSRREVGQYFWTYAIEIRNLSTETVQLRARHWIITDADGQVQHVRGLGVVGEQPILRPGELYRYASGCPLTTSHGIMVGTYEMVSASGERFEVEIPAFSLDMPADRRVLN
ncbi:MAG: Co2+/Mg2+ efflux protein ApaG [Beijerinckiaceae bacterium]|nr:Co2+/Mg2+ efflux protein ApaG [Beijerinckiaceae bacterium]